MFNFIICLCFYIFSTTTTTTTTADYLLDCGSYTNSTSFDGRNWQPDDASASPHTTVSTATSQDPSLPDTVPYMTARVSNTTFTYNFPLPAGPKFLRLYFYPAAYGNLNAAQSFFAVTANGFALLTNFSAFLTVSAANPKAAFTIKEFLLHVGSSNTLNVTFSPVNNSHAFINGIEIVSVPAHLYISTEGIKFVGQVNLFSIDASPTALETVYRLNVGGRNVPPTGDSGAMFRTWVQDDDYIFGSGYSFTPNRNVTVRYTAATPNYTAPEIVYTTSRTMPNSTSSSSNMTWIFPVDAGFYYLIRLHFCEIQLEVTEGNERVFRIFIDNRTAEDAVDVIERTGGTGIPMFLDYVVFVPMIIGKARSDIWLAMSPNPDSHPAFRNTLLNGLEMFKLNSSDGSLAGANPADGVLIPIAPMIPKRKGKRMRILFIIIGAFAGTIIIMVSILAFLVIRRRHHMSVTLEVASTTMSSTNVTSLKTSTTTSTVAMEHCRHFSLREIRAATKDFDDTLQIGSGGFGKVYKGYMDDGMTMVAIKRLKQSSKQGAHEFRTEIEMLSNLRHIHLVSLIGYCNEHGEMILVYEYMSNGTLSDHLFKKNKPDLSWNERLRICIGAAKGLHYLHTGADHTIIHRDVKSSNILLGEHFSAKVSDFGLSRIGPTNSPNAHVSTAVKGTFGYVDPEYYRRRQLTEKSDVYSFGVVLFEVLCNRPAVILDQDHPDEQVNLAQWVSYCYKKRSLERVIDLNLEGEIAPECLKTFVELALSCVRDEGAERPTMSDVVGTLEFALELQQVAERKGRAIDGSWNTDVGLEITSFGGPSMSYEDDTFSVPENRVWRLESFTTLEMKKPEVDLDLPEISNSVN